MSMIASESMVRSLAITVSPVIGFSPVWYGSRWTQISQITSARETPRVRVRVSAMPSFSTVNSWAVRKSGSHGLGDKTTHECQKGQFLVK